jgi:hypothetical protein
VPILCIPSDINNNGRFCAHAADARGPGLENLTETQKDLFLEYGYIYIYIYIYMDGWFGVIDIYMDGFGVIDFVPAAEKPGGRRSTRVRIGDEKM